LLKHVSEEITGKELYFQLINVQEQST